MDVNPYSRNFIPLFEGNGDSVLLPAIERDIAKEKDRSSIGCLVLFLVHGRMLMIIKKEASSRRALLLFPLVYLLLIPPT